LPPEGCGLCLSALLWMGNPLSATQTAFLHFTSDRQH
jgi:hypothetical protein